MLLDHTALVGRDAPLSAVAAVLDEAALGAARRVAIVGEPGIGKSRLLDEIAALAAARGWTVMRATGDPSDAVQPLAALGRALGRTVEPDGAARSGEGGLTWSVIGGNVAEGRVRDETRIVDVLDDLTRSSPVLISIDDVDLVDESTRRLLDRLADLLPAQRLVVLTSSTGADARADGSSLSIELHPLTEADVAQLVAASLGRTLGALAGPVRRAIAAARGVPLLVALALSEVVDGDTTRIDRALRDESPDETILVRAAIDRLPATTVDLLRTMAILGRAVELDDLLVVRTDDPLAVQGAIDLAVGAGFVRLDGDRVTIRNARVADALRAGLPGAVQRSIHGRFAAVLAERRASAALVAHHAVRASGTASHEAVSRLLDGGREVGSRAPTLALDLLEHAVQIADPDDPRLADVLTEMVAALGWTGAFERCEATARAVLARPVDDARRAAMRRALALCAFLQNRAATAAEECEHSAVESGDDVLRARALGEAALARMAAGDLSGAQERSGEAVEAGMRTGEPISRCVGWSVRSRLRAFELDLSESLELAERAMEIAHRDETGEAALYHPGFFRLLTLVDLDRLQDAAVELERERSVGDRAGLAWTQPLHHGLAAVIHLFAGRLDEAGTAAAAGQRAVDAVGSGLASVWLHAAAALVAQHQGRTGEARRHVDDGQRVLAAQVPLLGVDLLALAEARVLEAEGSRRRALETVQGGLELFETMGMSNCSRLIAPDVVRLACLTGRSDVASDAARLLDRLASRTGLAIDAAHAELAAALVATNDQRAFAAVELIDRSARRIECARVRESAAQVLWGADRRSDAGDLLDEALTRYGDVGATGDVARVRREFTDLGLRRPRRRRPTSELTQRESAIAELVAFGRTNGEVAEHLGISPRTVETHLTRIYAKLGLRSRTELAATHHLRTAPN